MALRAVPDHPKFAHLKVLLQLGKGATLGYLECVWHFAGRFTPAGNIGKYTDSEIENWVEWPGPAGGLIAALIEAKWVDRDENHRLVIHDWHQHADKATKTALKRANLDFCTLTVHTGRPQCVNTVPNSGNISPLPVPVPEPEPVPVPETPTAAEPAAVYAVAQNPLDASDDEREKAWAELKATPAKPLLSAEVETAIDQVARRIHGRHPALRRCSVKEAKNQLRAIARRVVPGNRVDLLHQVDKNHADWCAWPDWRKDGGQYAKGLDNWLAPTKERWSEPPPHAPGGTDLEPPKLMM